ncbi:MAG: type II secretion system protein GspD [Alphaproteobacteria bacterium]
MLLLLGCITTPEDLDRETDEFIESYLQQSEQLEAARAEQNALAIKEVTVTSAGRNKQPLVSLHLKNAPIRDVVEQILQESAVPYAMGDIAITGNTTIRIENLPLVQALNLILAPRGLSVSVENGLLMFDYGATTGSPSLDNDSDTPVRTQIALKHLEASVAVEMIGQLAPGIGVLPTGGFDESDESESGDESGQVGPDGQTTTTVMIPGDSGVVEGSSTVEFEAGRDRSPEQGARFAIAPIPGTNIVILAGPPEQVEAAITLLRFADQERPHVIIEALVIEADVAALKRLGARIGNGASGEFSGINLSPGSAFTDTLTFAFLQGAANPTQLEAMVDLLVEEDHARILSRPYASTLSHETASINITQDRYVVVQDAEFGGSTPLRSTRPISAGVKLQVTPKVLGDDVVRIQLSVEESEFLTSADQVNVATDSNAASTTMDVKSGRTIVIGGLFKREALTGNAGIPGLRNIPGLNMLFAQQEELTREEEVIVYITPHIWTSDTSPVPLRAIQRSIIDGGMPSGQNPR